MQIEQGFEDPEAFAHFTLTTIIGSLGVKPSICNVSGNFRALRVLLKSHYGCIAKQKLKKCIIKGVTMKVKGP